MKTHYGLWEKRRKAYVAACDDDKSIFELSMTTDPKQVTCLRCKRTKAFKEKANARPHS